jgi:hypothetical protein
MHKNLQKSVNKNNKHQRNKTKQNNNAKCRPALHDVTTRAGKQQQRNQQQQQQQQQPPPTTPSGPIIRPT